jgi:hypothetical protein
MCRFLTEQFLLFIIHYSSFIIHRRHSGTFGGVGTVLNSSAKSQEQYLIVTIPRIDKGFKLNYAKHLQEILTVK